MRLGAHNMGRGLLNEQRSAQWGRRYLDGMLLGASLPRAGPLWWNNGLPLVSQVQLLVDGGVKPVVSG